MEYDKTKNTNVKSKFFMTSFFLIIAGLLNTFINFDSLLKISRYKINTPIVIYSISAIASIGSLIIFIVILSLILYFVSAAMNKGFILSDFIQISIMSLQWLPLQIIINDALSLAGFNLAQLGLTVTLLYTPMYLLIGYSIYKKTKLFINTTNKQSVIISVFGTISLIGLTANF